MSRVWCAWCYHIHCDSVKKGNQNPNSIHHASRKKILPWKFLTEEHFDCNQCPKMVPIESDESNENSMEEKTASKTWKKIFYIYIQWDAITFYWKSISVCFCKVLVCSVFLPYLDCKLLLLYIFYEFFSLSLALFHPVLLCMFKLR